MRRRLKNLDDLSNRQTLILEAVEKMSAGKAMYEEGHLEFIQLTQEGSGNKQGSGGQDVTPTVRRISKDNTKASKTDRSKLAPQIDDLEIQILNIILNDKDNKEWITLEYLRKKLQAGWGTVRKRTDNLILNKKIKQIAKFRPGSKVPSNCFITA